MPPPLLPLRLLIIADSPFARAGIASLLQNQPLIDIIGQAAAEPGAAEQVRLFEPDIVIWEIPYDSDEALARAADLRDIRVPVLVLLGDESHALDILALGARGILLQTTNTDMLAAALMALANDLVVISPQVTFVNNDTLASPSLPRLDTLTSRELEVLRLVAEGLPNKQIALKLKISEHTVKFHVNAIMGKLGVQSRTEAVVRATRQGLIAL